MANQMKSFSHFFVVLVLSGANKHTHTNTKTQQCALHKKGVHRTNRRFAFGCARCVCVCVFGMGVRNEDKRKEKINM